MPEETPESRPEANLAALGLALPEPAAPVASYVPAVEAGGLLHISGQLPFIDGVLVKGRLGEGLTIGEGQDAARACALMLIAQMKAALGGSLDRVDRIVKLGAFIASTGDFTDQPKVANGASELMQAVFGAVEPNNIGFQSIAGSLIKIIFCLGKGQG